MKQVSTTKLYKYKQNLFAHLAVSRGINAKSISMCSFFEASILTRLDPTGLVSRELKLSETTHLDSFAVNYLGARWCRCERSWARGRKNYQVVY